MKIVSDHGFPKGDGSNPDDDPFALFKNERDYIAQSGRTKTTVAAMDWAAAEIERLRAQNFKYLQEIGEQARLATLSPGGGAVEALKFYADEANWRTADWADGTKTEHAIPVVDDGSCDCGDRARAALSALPPAQADGDGQ